MMLCLCACGMSDVERLHGEDILRAFVNDTLTTPDVQYTIKYSKTGDVDIELHVWPLNTSDEKKLAQIDAATKELMLFAEDTVRDYAYKQNIEVDDVTVTCTSATGEEYKSVNGNIIKTP